MSRPLMRSFFARDADRVARDLLGRWLVHETPEGRLALRIVETEAYFGPPRTNRGFARRRDVPADMQRSVWDAGDQAAHSHRGPTARNKPMFGPGGHAYVYLIYGMYECMNVSTGRQGDPQAVLLRAGEPVEGVAEMLRRRGVSRNVDVASGPGKLARALGVTRAHTGHDMTQGPVRFECGKPSGEVSVSTRVNVVGGEDLPLRFFVPGDPHVSRVSGWPR